MLTEAAVPPAAVQLCKQVFHQCRCATLPARQRRLHGTTLHKLDSSKAAQVGQEQTETAIWAAVPPFAYRQQL